MTRTAWCLSLCSLVASGCASTAVPRAQLDAASHAIEMANEAVPQRDTRALSQLHEARGELHQAEQFVSRGSMERARTMAMRAEADALLSTEIAHENEATVASGPTQGGAR
jgi:hypothetical protein